MKHFRPQHHREELSMRVKNALIHQVQQSGKIGVVGGSEESVGGTQLQPSFDPPGFWAKIGNAGQNDQSDDLPDERKRLPDNTAEYEWEEVEFRVFNDDGEPQLNWKVKEGGQSSTLLDNKVIVNPGIEADLSKGVPSGAIVWMMPVNWDICSDDYGGFGDPSIPPQYPSIYYAFQHASYTPSYGCQNGTESGMLSRDEGRYFSLASQYDHTDDVYASDPQTIDETGSLVCMEFDNAGEYLIEAVVFGYGNTATTGATIAFSVDVVKIDPAAGGTVVPIAGTQVDGHFHSSCSGEVVTIQPVEIAAGDMLTIRLISDKTPANWNAHLEAHRL
jgi:hypothetical protein